MPRFREEITKAFLRWTGDAPKKTPPQAGQRLEEETLIQPGSRVGQQIASYTILKRLGFGGMGHVYLAQDTRLGRLVALKFLPPELSSDRSLLFRLQQEAQTASALNHPNILTIYEMGEANGEHFIATEYVDGLTLRGVMEREPPDIGTAVDIASQIASALMSAHAAAIVHRDLKPTNIMIRQDGYVKVIDFGIAKYLEHTVVREAGDAATSTVTGKTRPGAIIGTVAYMSPEQARGEDVDHRADLWSLGVILYEMLAQRRPFSGLTETGVVAAIQRDPVPPLPNTKPIPRGLQHIVHCALAKEPAKRYQTAAEMLADLQHLGQSTGLSSRIRPVVVARRLDRRMKWIAAGAVLAAVAAMAASWWFLGGKERLLGPHWFRIASVRPVTFNGRTTLAALSPDGSYLAFVAGDPEGEETLYLKQVDSSAEEVKIPARDISYVGIAFSPDSKYIYETEKDDTLVGRLYAVPILGSKPGVPLVVDIDGPVAFSPSGKQFAFVRYEDVMRGGKARLEGALYTMATGGEPRKLITVHDATLERQVAWSPKGDQLALFVYRFSPSRGGQQVLELLDSGGKEVREFLPGWQSVGQPCWTADGRTLIVSSTAREEGNNQPQLRQIDVQTGTVSPITRELAGYKSASLSKDGTELAAVKQEIKASLWISAVNDFQHGRGEASEAQEHPSLAWQRDGRLIVNSRRSGFPNVWLFDASSQTRTALTNEPHVEQQAAPIPGSDSVVFSSNRDGHFHLWRFDPDVNRYTQLTYGANYDEAPNVSPDGQWVVYTSWTLSEPHLNKVAVHGGEVRQIGSYAALDPQISPDGKRIACNVQDPLTSKWKIAILPFDGSGPLQDVPGARLPVRWAPDGNALTTALTDGKGVANIWAIPVAGGAPRQLTDFEDDTILSFAWSSAGDRLACIRAALGADVALFTREKAR